MTEVDESYRNKTGSLQGDAGFYMKEDGVFKFWDIDRTGRYLRNFIHSFEVMPENFTSVVMSNLNSRVTSMGAIVAANSNSIPAGVWHFSLATGNSLWSMSIPLVSGYSGTRVIFRGDACIGDANIVANVEAAGGSVLGILGSDLSSMNLSAGFYLEMFAIGGSAWQVVDRNESVTERASA